MAALTEGSGFAKGGTSGHTENSTKAYKLVVDLNFADIITARAVAGDAVIATNDSLAILQIPAKTLVLAVGIDVTTADGTASTVDLGETGGDVDGWINGHNCNTVGSACSTNNTLVEGTPNVFEPAFGNGRYYSAADTIDMLFLTAIQDNSVMRVWAVCVDCA